MSYATYLSHHGKKGQKWGVQNGPPYPLNDVTKAIAYRGGQMSDGRQVANFTKRDVKKARRIVEKSMKAMSSDDIKEYRARLILEKEMKEILGTDTTDKLIQNLKNKAIEAAGNSVRDSGTKMLTNLEVNAVGGIVEAVFGPDVRNMITDGITKYQAENKKYEKAKDSAKNKLDKQNKALEFIKVYNSAKDEDIKEAMKSVILENTDFKGKSSSKSSEQTKQESPKQEQPKQKESSSTPKYEKVQGEIIDDTPKSNNDHEYVDKEKVNGEWRYYYEPTRYESWNSDYLLPGSTSSKSSKKKRKKK